MCKPECGFYPEEKKKQNVFMLFDLKFERKLEDFSYFNYWSIEKYFSEQKNLFFLQITCTKQLRK